MSWFKLFLQNLKTCVLIVLGLAIGFVVAAGIALLFAAAVEVVGAAISLIGFTVVAILIISAVSALIDYFT